MYNMVAKCDFVFCIMCFFLSQCKVWNACLTKKKEKWMTFIRKIKILIESSQAIIHLDLHHFIAGRWLSVKDSVVGPAGHLICRQLFHIFHLFLGTAIVIFLIYSRPLMAVYWSWKLKRGYNLNWVLWRGGLRLKLVWLALCWIQGLLYYVKQKVFIRDS